MNHQIQILFLSLFLPLSVFAKEPPIKNSVTLDSVVVLGTQLPTDVRNQPASVTVVSRNEIEKTEESSVLSSLKGLVPGLFITERGTTGFGIFTGSGGGISLRGIGGSPTTQVLIAIDGHPQMMGINGHDLPDAYVSYNAETIEVTRGPASTVFGSNAMGGVINIITREEKTNGYKLNGSMIMGSYNTQKYLLSLRGKKDKLSGYLSANVDKTDGHRANSAFNLFNTYAKLGYALSENYKASADFSLSDYRSTDPGPITRPAISDSLTADVTRGMASVTLDNRYEKTSGKVKLYYDYGHHAIYDGWQSDDINAGAMANQSFLPWKGAILTLGLDYKMYGGKALRTNNPNFHLDKMIREGAIYGVVRQSLNDKWTIEEGMRYNLNSVYGDEWVPKIGLTYRPTETTILKFSSAKGFRNPTIRELYVFAANEDLLPESMMNYEISYTQLSADKKLKGELVLYLSKGENMIQTVINAGIPKYFNTGKFNNQGLEAALQYDGQKNMHIYANYSYIHCEKPILATPMHQINLGADYTLRKMTWTVHFQQVQNYYLKVTDIPVKDNFTLLDAKIGYQLTKELGLFCKADNLLNSTYQMNYNYPMPGATILGGIKLSL